MRTPTQEAFLSLIRFEIAGTPLPDGFAVPDMDALLKIAERQDMTHLVYDALTRNGIACGSSKARSLFFASMWRVEQMDYELERMAGVFEDHGIDFIPLKGSVVRDLYPERWMRTSADIDLLIREDQEKTCEELLVKELGYEYDTDTEYIHHGTLYSPNNHVHVEPHWTLFHEVHSDKRYVELFDRVWERAVPDPQGRGHRYMLSDADVYTYHVAHLEKHLHQGGGCSIKGLLDLWMMDIMPDADTEGRRKEIEEGGLTRFEDRMKDLIQCWMEGLPAENDQLEQFILEGSLFGSAEMDIEMQTRKKGRIGYISGRLFMPLSELKLLYPVLEKHPVLLPIMWIRRWGKAFDKDSRQRFEEQVKATINADKDDLAKLGELADYLGLE